MVVYILPSNAKTLLGIFCNSNCIHLCSPTTFSKSSSNNVKIVEWLVFMPAVGLFVGSTLTISFGLACKGCTFVRSAFNVLFQKVSVSFTFRVYMFKFLFRVPLGFRFMDLVLGLGFRFKF